jgi:uncharacterized protein (TIGR03032 family)
MSVAETEQLWAHHHAEWRSAGAVLSHWVDGATVDPALLRARADEGFWALLESLRITLLVTREYEHLVVALCVRDGQPRASWFRLPHPSGLAIDRERAIVHLASTRNPNHVLDFAPVTGQLDRTDSDEAEIEDRPLMPLRSRYLPGALYLHDLAMIDGQLHANAVGQNAVIRLDPTGRYEIVWWPKCIEDEHGPDTTRNYIQLNSIAAGRDVASSFFTASSTGRSHRRPGHRDYPVDGRGVVLSGRTREPVATGLTRPHSARLDSDGRVWLDNSGYGELAVVEAQHVQTIARLPGWTRGLCLVDSTAFVGTSRVIPRYHRYAPGLDTTRSQCGVHAVDRRTGRVLGSVVWPSGNQIFAVDWVPTAYSLGFPAVVGGRGSQARLRKLSYRFASPLNEEHE